MSWGRKIIGRVLLYTGVALAYLSEWLCRSGAWLAAIDWGI